MTEHSRFDPDHTAKCSDCYEAALDFAMEQEDEARLDAMEEQHYHDLDMQEGAES